MAGVNILTDVVFPLAVTIVGTVVATWISAAIVAWRTHRKENGARSSLSLAGLAKLLQQNRQRIAATTAIVALVALNLAVDRAISQAWTTPPSTAPTAHHVTPLPLTTLASGDSSEQKTDEAPSIDRAGWGPERDIVSLLARTSTIALNSMTNNPVQGDERNFAQVRSDGAPNSAYSDQLLVEPGGVYVAFFYFNNDATESETAHIAEDVRLSVQAPGVFRGSTAVYGVITSSNATPKEVWDGFTLALGASNSEAALRYVSGSASVHVNGEADGTALNSDELFSPKGANLGCDALDGRLPSVRRCSGYVTLELRVDQPNFVVTSAARLKGTQDAWRDHVQAGEGDVVEVQVSYQNTGSNQQDNVILRASLPDGIRYVDDSTSVANSNTGGELKPTVDGVTSTGINVGSFNPSGNVYLTFDVIVDEPAVPEVSRWVYLPKFIRATTSAGYKEAPLTFVLLE